MRHYLAKMLPGPILTVSTRVSRYQVQSKTSLHLTSHLTWLLALSPRAWHLPFRPETEYAVFRVVGGKTLPERAAAQAVPVPVVNVFLYTRK